MNKDNNSIAFILFILLFWVAVGYCIMVIVGGFSILKSIDTTEKGVIYNVVLIQEVEEETEEVKEQPKVEVKSVSVKKEEPKEKPISNDAYLLAQIIHAEAKGEPYHGKIAVGNVILNRVEASGFPDTIEGVIFQKGQFSPVANGTIYNTPGEEAIKAAKEVLSGKKVVGENTLYFYNPDTATSDWIFTRDVVTKIGNHAFAI